MWPHHIWGRLAQAQIDPRAIVEKLKRGSLALRQPCMLRSVNVLLKRYVIDALSIADASGALADCPCMGVLGIAQKACPERRATYLRCAGRYCRCDCFDMVRVTCFQFCGG